MICSRKTSINIDKLWVMFILVIRMISGQSFSKALGPCYSKRFLIFIKLLHNPQKSETITIYNMNSIVSLWTDFFRPCSIQLTIWAYSVNRLPSILKNKWVVVFFTITILSFYQKWFVMSFVRRWSSGRLPYAKKRTKWIGRYEVSICVVP